MSNLQDILETLSDREIDFVFARSNAKTDTDARADAGISNGLWYGWPEERRQYLVEVANQLRIDTKFKAQRILQEAAEEAARLKVAGMKSRKENIAQAAATEILDRGLGKPTQKQEVKTEHSGEVAHTHKLDDALAKIYGDDE